MSLLGWRARHACSVDKSCPTLWPPWPLACQAPLSMGFPRQGYWSGLSFPSPGVFPNPGTKPESSVSSALAGRLFTTVPPGKPLGVERLGFNYFSTSPEPLVHKTWKIWRACWIGQQVTPVTTSRAVIPLYGGQQRLKWHLPPGTTVPGDQPWLEAAKKTHTGTGWSHTSLAWRRDRSASMVGSVPPGQQVLAHREMICTHHSLAAS